MRVTKKNWDSYLGFILCSPLPRSRSAGNSAQISFVPKTWVGATWRGGEGGGGLFVIKHACMQVVTESGRTLGILALLDTTVQPARFACGIYRVVAVPFILNDRFCNSRKNIYILQQQQRPSATTATTATATKMPTEHFPQHQQRLKRKRTSATTT